jgi:CBS domain containing-hemolysin-like protein
MLGVPPASETDETLEEREIRRVLARAGEAGNIDDAEVEMIERIFALDDTTAVEVMVPRPDVVTVPAEASASEIRTIAREAGHTRYPVVDADEQVLGFVDVKDLLGGTDESATASDLAHEMLVIPETVPIDKLLLQFRSEDRQMAAIIDEWGAFEGIATVEDVVEVVVGDLRDRFDTETGADEPAIRQQSDGTYEMDGGVPLWAASDALGTEFESPDYDTVGGLVLERLDRAPEPGDSVEIDGHVIEVESVAGSRISTLLVREAEAEAAADDESDASEA